MYSLETSLVILGMVVTGTARSVGVKVFYQLGCHNPLLIALLYLVGQSMALVVYGVSKCLQPQPPSQQQQQQSTIEYTPVETKVLEIELDDSSSQSTTEEESSDELSHLESQPHHPSLLHHSHSDPILLELPSTAKLATNHHKFHSLHHSHSLPLTPTHLLLRRQGSLTGLTEESHTAVAWVHSIPWQLKPILPGLFNLLNSALKWASFIYVAASIAEMLSSGLELVLSVVVARLVRKRQISSLRWAGVFVVAVGLATVHAADLWDTANHNNHHNNNIHNHNTTNETVDDAAQAVPVVAVVSAYDHWVGGMLILGQCITAAGQDMAEELFLQETDFPATLLLGMEGMVGLVFGIPLYLRFAPETPSETWATWQESKWKMIYVAILTMVFAVTGIFNILATQHTSSMTRNMWKNCRTLMVWLTGLVVFYSLGDDKLGEEWVVPDSFFIMGGFLIMLSGIYVYYKNK